MGSDARNDEESRRLAGLLGQLIRLSRRSVRSIEQEYGVGSSGLGKVLNGTVRLQAGHIFMILDALGMTPGQFFHLAYPKKEKPHPLVAELRRSQGLVPVEDEDEASGDFEERTRRVVLRLFADVVRGQDPTLLRGLGSEARSAEEDKAPPARAAEDGLR